MKRSFVGLLAVSIWACSSGPGSSSTGSGSTAATSGFALLTTGGGTSAGGTSSGAPAGTSTAGASSSAGGGPTAASSTGGLASGTAGGASAGSSGASSGAGTSSGTSGGFDAGALPPAQPIGVDLPDLLWAYLGQAPTDVAGAQAEMDAAVAHGFNHARFVASPFWPVGMTTGSGWVANPTAFFAAFDALVADAEARGLHLVPSLLWNVFTFADIAGEPLGDLFTPGTTARTMAESYITQVVGRYAHSPTILFWEIGNELNLLADLDESGCNVCDGGTNACGSLAPAEGTPCFRTSADDFYSCNACRGVATSQQDLGQFAEAVAELIQSIDSTHPVSNGNGYPRPSAYHLSVSPCPSCDWTLDTEAQYEQVLQNLTPPAVAVMSVHHYPGPDNERFGDDDPAGLALIATTQSIAQELGKQLYVGEYGEASDATPSCGGQTQVCGGDPNRSATEAALDAFVTQGVPYSALWALDFDQFCAGVPTCYTVTDTETDIVDSMAAHDQAYGACVGKADDTACPIGRCDAGACAPVPVADLAFTSGLPGAWIAWTNCSGCTPSTFQLDGGVAVLTTFDLPCSGSCQYPGGYALSPSFPLAPGHALVRVDAQASVGGPDFNVIVQDDGGNQIGGAVTDVSDAGFQVDTAWVPMPAGTASIAVRLEDPVPDAALVVRQIQIEWQP